MKQQLHNQKSLMQQALGKQWDQLPQALKAHYNNNESGENIAEGKLTIDFPQFMQLPLNAMRLIGALVNKKGFNVPTRVKRVMNDGAQYWHRSIHYPDGSQVVFKSCFTYDENRNEFTEYTNRFLGLKMRVFVEGDVLHYESCGYIFKLASLKIPLPEWLALGHASIIESSISNTKFKMDFRLKHPIFGKIFTYIGEFKTL